MSTNTIEYKNDGVYYNNVKIEGPNFENIIQASNYTLTTGDCTGFKLFNNSGAVGDIIYTLPPAQEGLEVTIVNTEEHNLKVQANSGDLIFTPKYKYGVDYVDLKQSVSTTFYCVNGTDWHAKEDLSTLWGQTNKLFALDGFSGQLYGWSTGLSENYFIASALYDSENGSNAGAAYIFHRTGTNTWDSGTKLVASDGVANDQFGRSVAISEKYAVVGTGYKDGIGTNSGAVYVYSKVSDNLWSEAYKIVSPNEAAYDYFGDSVDISGDYLIAAGYMEGAGSAYIFHRTGTNTWDSGTKLVASDGAAGDLFGRWVSISGDYAIVGAERDDDNGTDSGSAYIFHRTGTNTWDSGTKLVASDGAPGDSFGASVSISTDYAIVGAYRDDDNGTDSGSAYIFHRTGTNTWDSGAKILPPDYQANMQFANKCAISGDYAIFNAVNISGASSSSGALYVFKRNGLNSWVYNKKVFPFDGQFSDGFSTSLDISGQFILANAGSADGVSNSSGASYIFTLE